jgi:DNA-binding transcriptional LysR family regulator
VARSAASCSWLRFSIAAATSSWFNARRLHSKPHDMMLKRSNGFPPHPDLKPPAEIRFHDHHLPMVEAAAAGLGVALSPLVLVTDEIAQTVGRTCGI